MKIQVVIHKAQEGGYWAEVPALPGCASQGEDMEQLLGNIREAIEGSLSIKAGSLGEEDQIIEIAV